MPALTTTHTVAVAIAAAVIFNLIGVAISRRCAVPAASTAFQPPGQVFAVVWPVLYSILGVVFAILIRATVNRTAPTPWLVSALTLFSVQMVMNFSWMPVYSCAGKREAALYMLVALFAVQATTQVVVSQVSMPATTLLAPYTAWLVFAMILNTNQLN